MRSNATLFYRNILYLLSIKEHKVPVNIFRSVFIMNFSNRLKELRQHNKVSQQELADLLGISTRAWRFYESGDREPNIAGLITLADFFNVPLDYLVGRSGNNNKR